MNVTNIVSNYFFAMIKQKALLILIVASTIFQELWSHIHTTGHN